jgi:hypothetical protein
MVLGAGKPGLDRCNEGTRPHQIAPGVQNKKKNPKLTKVLK